MEQEVTCIEKVFSTSGICEFFGVNSIIRGALVYPIYLVLAGTKDDDRILDSGSGFGSIFFGSWMYHRLDLISLDISSKMIWYADKIARAMNFFSDANNRRVIKGSSADIPLDDGSIDTVIDCHSLVYNLNMRPTLSEYRRILKPKGCMILVPHTNRDMREAVEDTFHSYIRMGNYLALLGNPPLKVIKE